jgi:hypothetical protein
MPESVTDRCTKSHEMIFLLTKSARYFFDSDAIREDNNRAAGPLGNRSTFRGGYDGMANQNGSGGNDGSETGRNKRSVWNIATEAYSEAHFATFPQALVRPCILAGTSEHGVCSVCGAPWARVTERTLMVIDRSERTHELGRTRASGTMTEAPTSTITGWAPTCKHEAPAVPATILDPFLGSGTSALVAKALGRKAVGIDLSAEYLAMAVKRCAQLGLMA